VFKKLDKLIVKAFIGPFIATFFITVVVLVMQFFWLYIDDFVGNGIDTSIIFEFIKVRYWCRWPFRWLYCFHH
jgi:lipopolysaccharide export system permease protein